MNSNLNLTRTCSSAQAEQLIMQDKYCSSTALRFWTFGNIQAIFKMLKTFAPRITHQNGRSMLFTLLGRELVCIKSITLLGGELVVKSLSFGNFSRLRYNRV